MIRKLINTGLAATLIVLPVVNVGKAKAQNPNVDVYLVGVNLKLDAYINSALVAKNSGMPTYLYCILRSQIGLDLQNGIIAGAISRQNRLYQSAAQKILDLGQISNCSNF